MHHFKLQMFFPSNTGIGSVSHLKSGDVSHFNHTAPAIALTFAHTQDGQIRSIHNPQSPHTAETYALLGKISNANGIPVRNI